MLDMKTQFEKKSGIEFQITEPKKDKECLLNLCHVMCGTERTAEQ